MGGNQDRDKKQIGRYEVISPIAQGGMASVFAGRLICDGGFEKLVAIKLIHPHLSTDAHYVNMFLDEARLSAGIHHPNVAEVYEVGQERGLFYMVSELVEGQSLRSVFDRCNIFERMLPPVFCAYIVSQICRGLHAAHERRDENGTLLGLVHRDVSPQNILISYEGDVKLIDFGVAWAAGRMSETEAGILKGKLSYMSPEQVSGAPVDRRSDIFAVGIVLYELLIGRTPFTGGSEGERMLKLVDGEFVRPREVNPSIEDELDRIVMKALSPLQSNRYQTAAELAVELEAVSIGTEGIGQQSLQGLMHELFHRDRDELSAFLTNDVSGSNMAEGNFTAEYSEDGRRTLRLRPIGDDDVDVKKNAAPGQDLPSFEAIFERAFCRLLTEENVDIPDLQVPSFGWDETDTAGVSSIVEERLSEGAIWDEDEGTAFNHGYGKSSGDEYDDEEPYEQQFATVKLDVVRTEEDSHEYKITQDDLEAAGFFDHLGSTEGEKSNEPEEAETSKVATEAAPPENSSKIVESDAGLKEQQRFSGSWVLFGIFGILIAIIVWSIFGSWDLDPNELEEGEEPGVVRDRLGTSQGSKRGKDSVSPNTVRIPLTVKPLGATLKVDGLPRGFGSNWLEIEANSGEHIIEASAPGYRAEIKRIDPRVDKQILIELEPIN